QLLCIFSVPPCLRGGCCLQIRVYPRLSAVSLFGRCIRLENAERVSFGVDEISLPADTRDGKLWHRDLAAEARHLRRHVVKTRNFHGAHKGIGPMLRRRRLGWALQQPAARSGSFNAPVLDREAFNFVELPAKDLSIEAHRAVRVVSLDFEICRSIHEYFPDPRSSAQIRDKDFAKG